MNGGTCRENGNDYSCDCTVWWKGEDCDIVGTVYKSDSTS